MNNKKKWLLPVILGVAGVIILAGVAGFICLKMIILPKKQVEKYLAEGTACHTNLDDKSAILSYKSALEIDPDNESAYLGLADAYESLIARYLKNKMPEEAVKTYTEGIETLQKGCSMTGSAELQSRLTALIGKEAEISEEADRLHDLLEMEAIASTLQPYMDKIAELAYTNNWDGVFEYMQSAEYENFLNERQKLEDKWIFKTTRGDIGFYKVNDKKYGEYMLYLGYYSSDDLRDGNADWFGYYNGNNYHGHGSWKEDVPQGYWEVTEWNNELSDTVGYRYVNGYVIDGLLDGNVEWNFDFNNGKGLVRRRCVFDHGRWVVTAGPDKEGNYISATPNSNGIYLTEEELNEVRGVVGYATN